jgi:histidyl-tRNA synthetase
MFHVSDRKILESFFSSLGVPADEAFTIVDKRSKVTDDEFYEMLSGIGLDEGSFDTLRKMLDINGNINECVEEISNAPFEKDEGAKRALSNLKEVGELLKHYGLADHCKLDLSIVRGLAYYTDMVFEVFDRKKSMRSLFGGGRYDDLISLFGGQRMPAVGFAIGIPMLEILMKEEGVWPEADFGPDYFIVTIGDVDKAALEIIRSLRQIGVVEFSYGSKNMSNQMNLANNLGAKRVVIVGERDVKEGKVTIKDMISGDQETVPIEELVSGS